MNTHIRWFGPAAAALLAASLITACGDDYIYDKEAPSWLGENVYDYLDQQGNYKTYLALINELGYGETLKRTGSKTLFPANDEAFDRYFKSIGMSARGPEAVRQLGPMGQRRLFNSSMLNMAYLDNMLSNVPTAADGSSGTDTEGTALARETAASNLDSIAHVPGHNLPATTYWSRFAERGIWLADGSSRPNVIFSPAFMQRRGMTPDDWALISGGKTYETKGFYVNGVRVTDEHRNVTCKNGYLHLADDVVRPLNNIAEVIISNPTTSLFAHLMNKFSAPYFVADIDANIRGYYTDGSITDSVFVKRYFNDNGSGYNTQDPEGHDVGEASLLYFDPAHNMLSAPGDIGVMFVPTDEAMQNYWKGDRGKFLRDVYGDWDNVPNDVLSKFIKNHQLKSFVGSLPNGWDILADQKGFHLGIKASDVTDATIACNGLVYRVNRVFPPIDYQCAYAPTLTSPLTRVMKMAIDDNDALKFHLYLRSLENQYNLFVPVDEGVKDYRDPITWAIWANGGIDKREVWSFKVQNERIFADIYGVDANGNKAKLLQTIGATSADQDRIMNRMRDILDMHIVVADNESEPMSDFADEGRLQWGLTKGGTVLNINGSGADTHIAGGGDREQGTHDARILNTFVTDNSHTFFIDRILQDPFRSVYTELKSHPEFSEFYNLLLGDPTVFSYFQTDDNIAPIFDQMASEQSSGVGQVVTTFNNFRYTILVPTNDAVKQAFASDKNLWTWERIAMEDNAATKREKALYLLNFLRRHIVDGAVPLGVGGINREYDTAARDKNNQFVKLHVTTSASGATFGADSRIVTSNPALYNILTRDYIVDNRDPQKANNIVASSRAIIHLIDKAIQ